MDSITIKVDERMSRAIDQAMKGYYSTKTEFIREAIREKLNDAEKKRALEALERNFGRSKKKTTDEELHVIREKVGREFAKRAGIKLD